MQGWGWFTCNCLSTWALFSWTTSTTHSHHNINMTSFLIIFILHWSESKIFKSSEGTTSRSEGSDGNTPRLNAGLPSSSKDTASNTKNQRTTSKKKRERKERTPKECLRDPPELNRVLPSLADIKATTRPSKHADLPVDVLLPTVKDCELLPCYSELKKPYICYFDDLGNVFFSDASESQEKVKVALLRCCKVVLVVLLSLLRMLPLCLDLKQLYLFVHVVVFTLRKFRLNWCNSYEW